MRQDDYQYFYLAAIAIYIISLLIWLWLCTKLGYKNNSRLIWSLLLSFPLVSAITVIIFLFIPSPNERALKKIKQQHQSELESLEKNLQEEKKKYIAYIKKLKKQHADEIELEQLKAKIKDK